MSFWDLAQTAATIAAGTYLGPAAGAAVGGGLSALRGKDILTGTVTGYMGGMGGESMNAAANQTALKAGVPTMSVNAANLANTGITTGTNAMVPTMTGFGGAGAGTGINTGINALPTASNVGNFGNVRNIDATIGGSNLTGYGGNYNSSMRPVKTPIPQNLQGVGGIPSTPATMPSYMDTSPKSFYNSPTDNLLPPLETPNTTTKFEPLGVGQESPNFTSREVPLTEQYDFSETIRRPGEMPDGGFSMSEKFDAVTNNPREFMKNLGGGNELYGAGKLGLTGLGLAASAMEEDVFTGDNYTSPFTDNRFRGPQGQLNLAGLSSLNVNDPYSQYYAEGGYLSGGNVPGDGMSDSIPAMIGRGQQAALSEGEFVIPADVVSHLGNGSSNAGSKQLYAMMDQVRKDRTGTAKQGKEINPERYMPA